MLAEATDLDGEVSLKIDTLEVALKEDGPVIEKLRGQVLMHEVRSTAGPAMADMLDVVGLVFRRDVPRRVQVVKDSTINFELIRNRLHHSGFAFVLPNLAPGFLVTSSGSVGFDQTLDLVVSLDVPKTLVDNMPVVAKLVAQPIEIPVKGTIEDPQPSLPANAPLTDFLATRLVPTADGKPEAIPDAVIRLIRGVGNLNVPDVERTQALPGTILNLIRSIQDERKRREANGETPLHRPPVRPRTRPRLRRRPGRRLPARPQRPPA